MISVASLIAGGIHPTQAKSFAEPLNHAAAQFAINTPVRQAAFVAQCAYESAMFTRLEEGLFYRTPERIHAIFPRSVPTLSVAMSLVGKPESLANVVYACKNGNGSAASGDGWKYRGRGLIQLTGKANYLSAEKETGQPYTKRPELLQQPEDAALSAAWFWSGHGLNALADSSQIDGITRAVNGPAMLGASERRQLTAEMFQAFN